MTSSTPTPTEVCRPSWLSIRSLHLFTLSSFAITQPLLIALESQAVYLRDQQVDWNEVGVLMAVLVLVLPLGLLVLDQIVWRLSRFTRGYGRNLIFGLLFVTILLSLLRPYVGTNWLTRQGLAGLLSIAIAIPGSWVLVSAYEHVRWLRSWVTYASIGLIVFPSAFLWQFYVVLRAEREIDQRVNVKNPIPVVFVIFDEFSGSTLMNEQMEIDALHFPHFARLAECSTWYRKMTTVHPRTGTAVPAILSGRFPITEKPPIASEYPGNLFEVIHSSKQFDMTVFEPATRICPNSLEQSPEPKHSFVKRTTDLLYTLAAVYPRLILARDMPVYLPVIPQAWFGINEHTTSRSPDFDRLTEGMIPYDRGVHRDKQLEHFLRCLLPSERPRFSFIHCMIPHYPWCFLPTGEKYLSEMFYAHGPPVGQGELAEDWPPEPSITIRNEYRYRLQVGFVDSFIGRVLDRLNEAGIMDQCLLIVTSDHGVAFRPGHSRRQPDSDNIGEIMSVPLFIKFPGQKEGRIDDRNVESVDILPTIADVLGIELPEPVDGSSVTNETRRPRKTIYFEKMMTVVEPDFPQLTSAVRRHTALFGAESLEQMPISAASHPKIHGLPVTNFSIDEQQTVCELFDPLHFQNPSKSALVDSFVVGDLFNLDLPKNTGSIAIAVNGIIFDSTKLIWWNRNHQYFEFLLPRSLSNRKVNKIDLYLIEQLPENIRLRPLKPRE